jgi:ribose transport system substrate-binding protein
MQALSRSAQARRREILASCGHAHPVHISILLLCAIALAGCAKQAPQIAVIPRTTAVTIWEAEHAGANIAAQQAGARIYWNAPTSEDDLQQQVALVERVMTAKYDGLVLAPDQPLAFMAPVQQMLRRGMRVVVIGSPLPIQPGQGLFYILNDDEASGRLAALRMGKILSGHGRVAVVGVGPESLSDLAILHSFETTLEKNFPKVVITVRRSGTRNGTEANRIVDEILSAPDAVDAIFTLSAAASTGASSALHARGLTGKVRLIGFEQSAELANLIRRHEVDSVVAEDTYGMGYLGVRLLVGALGQGQAQQTTMLEPTLLTAENIDSPEVRNLIQMDWSKQP